MTLGSLILDIIHREPGLYGVEISDRLEARAHEVTPSRAAQWASRVFGSRSLIARILAPNLSTGAVYVAIDRLEDQGLITSSWGIATPERGGRRRLHFYPAAL